LYYSYGVKEFEQELNGISMAEQKAYSVCVLYEYGIGYFLVTAKTTITLIIDLREIKNILITHEMNRLFRKRTFLNNALAASGGLLGGLLGLTKSKYENAKTRTANSAKYKFIFKNEDVIEFYVEELLTDYVTPFEWNDLLFNKSYKELIDVTEVIKQRKVVQCGICVENFAAIDIIYKGYGDNPI
jgi:hypothetical protein